MSLSRRSVLSIIGGGSILAASGFAYAASLRPATAHLPWAQAGGYDDVRMRALSFALLAPNPHNRQPWLVDLSQPDEVVLYADTTRFLPQTDPFNRQITIGLGGFVELMRMAAAAEGYGVEVALFPEGFDDAALDARPVMRARFGADAGIVADPLFAHVGARRSTKEAYDVARAVPDGVLAAILAAVPGSGGSVARESYEALRVLSHAALAVEVETPRTYRESVDLFRIGRGEVDANPDGIDFTGPLFESLRMVGLFSRDAALDTASSTYRAGMEAIFANTDTAMGHIWLVSAGNSRKDQIAAGAAWLRLNLAATAAGVAVQPLSQALQEYPEMAALYGDIHRKLAPGGGTVQMFARIGYGPDVTPSPRWPLEAKILKG